MDIKHVCMNIHLKWFTIGIYSLVKRNDARGSAYWIRDVSGIYLNYRLINQSNLMNTVTPTPEIAQVWTTRSCYISPRFSVQQSYLLAASHIYRVAQTSKLLQNYQNIVLNRIKDCQIKKHYPLVLNILYVTYFVTSITMPDPQNTRIAASNTATIDVTN